jgi:hypothetical protein
MDALFDRGILEFVVNDARGAYFSKVRMTSKGKSEYMLMRQQKWEEKHNENATKDPDGV